MKAAVVLALLLATAASAAAETDVDDGPPGVTPPVACPASPIAPPAKPAEPKKLGLDALQARAASNRGLVGSTALTVPEGKIEVSLQAVVPFAGIASLNAGVTKTTELWIDGVSTIAGDGGDSATAYGAGIKQVLFRDRKLAFALTGSLRKMSDYGDGRSWKSLGAVGTLCIDDGCGLVVSGAVQHLFGYQAYQGDTLTSETMVTLGISAGTATTRFLVDTITLDGATVGFLGLRLGNASGAFDVGFAKALGDHGSDQTVPWVGVTGRL